MARKGRFSSSAPRKGDTASVKSSKSKVNLSEAGGISPTEQRATRGMLFLRYVLFGVAVILLGLLISGAVLAWMGTVLATMSGVTSKTSLMTMLNSWFMPMIMLSVLMGLVTFAALRRIWHFLEKRFN